LSFSRGVFRGGSLSVAGAVNFFVFRFEKQKATRETLSAGKLFGSTEKLIEIDRTLECPTAFWGGVGALGRSPEEDGDAGRSRGSQCGREAQRGQGGQPGAVQEPGDLQEGRRGYRVLGF